MYQSDTKEQGYNTIIGGLGSAQASNKREVYPNATIPIARQSVTSEIINRLESTNALLNDVICSQRNLLERLHGPRAENSCVEKSPPIAPGLLNTIDERLNWLMNSAQEVASYQQTLDRLA